MKKFKDWKEIKKWAEDNGFVSTAKRMQLNNDCWMSSGEFGRSQVAICDAIRLANNEQERREIGEQIEMEIKNDELSKILGG